METADSINLGVTIARPFGDVYAFLAELENLPQWATGIGRLRRKNGVNAWLAEAPDGSAVTIKMTPKNDFGIVDHHVIPEEGDEIYVPMRVVRNLDGSEVIFTLFRGEDMTDDKFAKDRKTVEKDLKALKKLLEG